MPQVTVYIRNEDLPKWKALEKKAEFLHDALTNLQLTDIPMAYDPEKGTILGKPAAEVLTTDEEDDDEYEDLIYDPIMNGVYDKSLGDYIDADIHMVKELKKRGQVR